MSVRCYIIIQIFKVRVTSVMVRETWQGHQSSDVKPHHRPIATVGINHTTSRMPYPPPETVSRGEFIKVLAHLGHLLGNLPSQLPRWDGFDSVYSGFLNFSLDEDILEKTGDEVATLGEQLERVFGWQTRPTGDGVIPITERGRAICALLPIFEKYHEKYPDNNVLKKWVIDVALGAERVFELHQVSVCCLYHFLYYLA